MTPQGESWENKPLSLLLASSVRAAHRLTRLMANGCPSSACLQFPRSHTLPCFFFSVISYHIYIFTLVICTVCTIQLSVLYCSRRARNLISFISGTDAKAEAPILWLPELKSQEPLEKPLMLGKIEGRRRKGDRG